MKIFDKRPLCLLIFTGLVSFVIFSFGNLTVRAILIAISVLAFAVTFSLKNIQKQKRIFLIILSCTVLIFSLFSFLYFNIWFNAHERFDDDCEIIGKVESQNFESGNKTLVLQSETIDGKAFSSYKLLVEIPDESITNITPGAIIKFKSRLIPFSDTSNAKLEGYYKSKGFSSVATDLSSVEILDYEDISLTSKISNYRLRISRRLVLNSDFIGGGLLSALLLGEREYLSGQFSLNFSRIGISHILALSGMHFAILTLALSKILSVFSINKKWRKLFEIIFSIAYMALTGFSPSVVRAGIMVVISALLFLLSSTSDSTTNLFISVLIICIINPYSIFDLSLWLSAFATLGVIICVQLFDKYDIKSKSIPQKALAYILSSFLLSLFAITATLPFSLFSFESTALFSLITTLIFSPLILIFMYIGCVFAFFPGIKLLGSIISAFGALISKLATFFSSYEFALVDLRSPLSIVLIIITSGLSLYFIVFDIKKRKIFCTVISGLLITTLLTSLAYSVINDKVYAFEYYASENDERILLSSNGEKTIIALSGDKISGSYETVDYLNDHSILSLDNYVITKYSFTTLYACESLFKSILVNNVYIPAPINDYQNEVYEDIDSLSKEYRINLIEYSPEKIIESGEFNLCPTYFDNYGRLALTIEYNGEFFSYLSSDMLDDFSLHEGIKIINGANTVIIGSSGSSAAQNDFILKIPEETKLIYNNRKKGLSAEILDYYGDRLTIIVPNQKIDLYVE